MSNYEVFDYLDRLASMPDVEKRIGCLSSGERIYVALAANRPDLLCRGDSIVYALYRLGSEWRNELIERHHAS